MIRKTRLANRKNYGNKRALSVIEWIVLHFTANDGDTDEANGNYFANNIVKASAHLFVDDDSCTQSVPDDYAAYSVGGKKYPGTSGGRFYGKCTNTNSLSIEMCDTVKNGVVYPTEKTLQNTIEIVREKMRQYNIPIERVIRHYDVTGKKCPAYFVEEKAWQEFKKRLVSDTVADPDGAIKNSGSLQSMKDVFGEVSYQGHLRNIGWAGWQSDGMPVGSMGQNRRIEALHIKPVGQMDVIVHIKDIGDKQYKDVTKDTVIGTVGAGKRLEAVRIDSKDTHYRYRVHQKDIGWSAWVENGQWAGVKGKGKQLEALEIRVIHLKARGHVQNVGWKGWRPDEEVIGEVGKGLRLEALQLDLLGQRAAAKVHIQNSGWKEYQDITKDTIIGTVGKQERIECLSFKGNFEYRVHVQGSGWTNWTKADGVSTLGTVGQALRIEAIEFRVRK